MKVTVVGDVNPDVLYVVDGFPVLDSQEIARELKIKLGGSAANTAYALAKLGAKVIFYGAVGKDFLGKFCEEELKRVGVKAKLRKYDVPTGITSAVEYKGTRTMFTYRGSNEFLDTNGIHPEGDWLHIAGYWHLKKLRPKIEELLKSAKERGMYTSFDIGSWNKDWKESEYILSAIKKGYLDFLFLNTRELEALTGMNADEAIEELRRYTTIGLHMGRSGAKIIWAEGEHYTPAWKNIIVRYTTGAGDTWNAGFIWAFLKERDVRRASDIAMDIVERYVQDGIIASP